MPDISLMTIQEGINRANAVMSLWSGSPYLDSQVLIAHILEQPRSWVLAHPETDLSPNQADDFKIVLDRLKNGEPLPYVLGHWEFFGLDFLVNPYVLIPRPETELLVEHALRWLERHPSRRLGIDVGTGSGCIMTILAKYIHDLLIFGTDLSWHALNLARENASRYNLDGRVSFVQCNLLSGIKPRFDLICANLPYIPTQRLKGLQVFNREPTLALDGGIDGFDLLERLIKQAPAHLNPGGLLLLEIDISHPEKTKELARGLFPDANINLVPDLTGRNRLITIQV